MEIVNYLLEDIPYTIDGHPLIVLFHHDFIVGIYGYYTRDELWENAEERDVEVMKLFLTELYISSIDTYNHILNNVEYPENMSMEDVHQDITSLVLKSHSDHMKDMYAKMREDHGNEIDEDEVEILFQDLDDLQNMMNMD